MKIGVISAMPIEIDYLLTYCDEVKEIKLKKTSFFQCDYLDYELYVVASGVGKTNATMYTQVLIDFFEPAFVINIGIGGGVESSLKPLDLVLGTSFSHHDVTVSQMENLSPFTSVFFSDSKIHSAMGPYFDEKNQGKIVSGEVFISDEKRRKEIIKTHNPLLVDMETSSIAHCCYLNDKPFISLRCVSDLADDSAPLTYEVNEKLAADKAGEKLLSILKQGLSIM